MTPDMRPVALLVSTETGWFGAARIPRALAKAGFDVALLTPPNALAEKSRFVGKVGHLPENASTAQWVFALAAMVKATAPRIILPTDDMSFRLLALLHAAPPPGFQPALYAELAALIRASLGDPGYYHTSVDKTLLPPVATALDVRVPPFVVTETAAGAEAFADEHGYPVVIKRSHSTGGKGVAICENREELLQAFSELAQPSPLDFERPARARLLVQRHIVGRVRFYPCSAWKGVLLAGMAGDRLVAHPEPKGPATVLRYTRSPEVRDIAAKLVRGLGMSGLFSFECTIEDGTGLAWLLEINRRVGPGNHHGSRYDVDQCAALHAAMLDLPSPTREQLDPDQAETLVQFPQEWLRDPGSDWLRKYPVDVPWDEPELIEAFLALRHER